MAWYCDRMANIMGVGPAGRKSNTPQLSGLRITVRRSGGMTEVKRAVTRIKD